MGWTPSSAKAKDRTSWAPVASLARCLRRQSSCARPVRPVRTPSRSIRTRREREQPVTAIQRILCRVSVVSLLTLIPAGQQAMAGRLTVHEFTLTNGLKVLLVEEPKAPVVTVQIWYKVGSRNEVMGRAGLSHMLEHMMFKGTPKYGKGVFSKIIEKNGGNDNAFTSQDYTAYYETHYVPNNATLVIVGDVKPETALPLIKTYFEGIPQGSPPPPPSIVEPEQKGERRIVVKRDAQLPFLYFGYKVPNFKSSDVHALAVLENILSTGKSARLYDALVYRKKLALQVGAGYNELAADPELFTFYATVKPAVRIAAVERAVLAEIDRLKKEPPTDHELQKAKNQVEARYLFEQDSVFRQAMLLGTAETVGAGWQYVADYVDKLRGITKEDVHRVAKKYLNEDTRTVGILIPLPSRSDRADAMGGAR